MKFRTLIHRKLRKAVFRAVRFNPVVERMVNRWNRSSTIHLPEIHTTVTIKPNDIIIDCGANVGNISSRFAAAGATIYAFEPDPEPFRLLSRRFRGRSNIHCVNKGVMDRPGTVTLYVEEAAKSDRVSVSVKSSFFDSDVLRKKGRVEVECVDLAAFIFSLSSKVRLLKMDIEGAECRVLNHLLDTGAAERVDLMVVETHERQIESLGGEIDALRQRIGDAGLADRIRLDWI